MLATAALAALVPEVAAETKPTDPKAAAIEKEFRELLRVVHRAEGEPESTAERSRSIFGKADLNANGSIDFNEFLRFHASYISVPLKALRKVKAEAATAGSPSTTL